MAITRRTGLAGILGGIFAPLMAENVPAVSTPVLSYKRFGGALIDKIEPEDPIARLARLTSRKEELRKIANGEFSDWQERRMRENTHISDELEAIKSVSPAGKRMIITNRMRERMKKDFIEEAKRELEHLEKYWENILTGKPNHYDGPQEQTNYSDRARGY